jgi:excisionase family DNA binding protein
MEALFSVPKAAEIMGVSDRMVRYMVSENRIPFFRIGTRVLFRASELEAWLQSQHYEAKSPEKPVDFLHANKFSAPEMQIG